MYHQPVLLESSVNALCIKENGIYVDATFGGGGHSKEILKQLGPNGRLIAIDQDSNALTNKPDDERITLIHGNFRFLKNYIKYLNIDKVDGILADLGVSSHHFDTQERGFSYRFDADLDMRMNTSAESNAKSILNEYNENQLTWIFKTFGEFKQARKLARLIVKTRENKEISSNQELTDIIKTIVIPNKQIKAFSQIYQAIRIEVNDEIDALSEFLLACSDVVAKDGKLVVIAYHSLEDRLAKRYIKSGNISGELIKDMYGNIIAPFTQSHKKVIIPSDEEIELNSRAKPAKLRIAVKN